MITSASQPLVSIVVLSYNRPAFLREALASIRNQAYQNLEVIVVDNPSPASAEVDRVLADYSDYRLLRNRANIGFAGGMNRGIEQATGDYIYLTEDDITLDGACIGRLLDYSAVHESGLVSPIMYNKASGTIRCAGGELTLGGIYRRRTYGEGEADQGQYGEPTQVTYVDGAAMFGRARLFKDLGGFREEYFMYVEAVEFCSRVAKHGGNLTVLPQARVYHFEPASEANTSSLFSFHKHKNLFSLYLLHAPIRVLPEFFFRYAALQFLRSVARRDRKAWPLLKALLWATRHAPALLWERRSAAKKAGTRVNRRPMKTALRKAVYRFLPQRFVDAYLHGKMILHVRRLAALESEDGSAWVDALLVSPFFRLLQKRTEVVRLMAMLRTQPPSAICEIGAAGGGTTFLFTRVAAPDAVILTVDLKLNESRRAAFQHFARAGQSVVALEGDSHETGTLAAVRYRLEGRALDLLYLDGDHTYDGVSSDLRLYGPLVRAGGMIIFHDIVPDFRSRHGVATASDTGDVPRLWRELKASGVRYDELVEDERQDGFGLGLLYREISRNGEDPLTRFLS